jgi:hypothetical protein
MIGKISKPRDVTSSLGQLWKDPTTNLIMATQGKPDLGFKEVDGYAIYDLNADLKTRELIAKGDVSEDALYNAFIDSSLEETTKQYIHDVRQGGQQKFAALRSTSNADVDILNVWSELQGRKDRKYAGKNLAREVSVPNLLLTVDRVKQFTGLTKIDEGQLGKLKELRYSRQNFEAAKYGLKFVQSEESRLKNVHNTFQDAVQIAGNKIDQRASFDVIEAANTLSSTAVIGVWDTFVATADRSNFSPVTDIGIASLKIGATGVGGTLRRIGMHQLTFAKYLENTFIRGNATATPVEYSFEVGTRDLPGIPGIGLVLDQGFEQGRIYCVDNEGEDATILYLQGPQRIGTALDEETQDQKYFVIDYHNAVVARTETGLQKSGAITPIAWS